MIVLKIFFLSIFSFCQSQFTYLCFNYFGKKEETFRVGVKTGLISLPNVMGVTTTFSDQNELSPSVISRFQSHVVQTSLPCEGKNFVVPVPNLADNKVYRMVVQFTFGNQKVGIDDLHAVVQKGVSGDLTLNGIEDLIEMTVSFTNSEKIDRPEPEDMEAWLTQLDELKIGESYCMITLSNRVSLDLTIKINNPHVYQLYSHLALIISAYADPLKHHLVDEISVVAYIHICKTPENSDKIKVVFRPMVKLISFNFVSPSRRRSFVAEFVKTETGPISVLNSNDVKLNGIELVSRFVTEGRKVIMSEKKVDKKYCLNRDDISYLETLLRENIVEVDRSYFVEMGGVSNKRKMYPGSKDEIDNCMGSENK